MKRMLVFSVVIVLLALPMVSESQYGFNNNLDVPYVPTKYEVVDEMLKMADVRSNDILYDLGCGDGRIVITAARQYGASGTGVDLDPERIAESNKNAEEEGVTDRVRFLNQDLFQTDISEATVVSLYLLSSVNLKLRPILLRDLKPGTRIVSHNYSMGEWDADRFSEVNGEYDSHSVYFWVVPGNVSGTWEWNLPQDLGGGNYRLNLSQKYQEVSGTATVNGNSVDVQDILLTGDRLRFYVERNIEGRLTTIRFEGLVHGNTLGGLVVSRSGSVARNSAWSASRRAGTMGKIEGDN